MTLYILNYNNYYNRILKKEDSLEAYLENVIYYLDSVNFNHNDNVYTEHIIGVGDYNGTGDYLVVTNEYNEIVSRWFILEAVRTRGGQYKLELYRDTLVDYYDQIISSPVFIEKANLTVEDPLIFNNEDISVNQIKQSEFLLRDATQCAWIVGYYAKDTSADNLKGTVALNPIDDIYDVLIDVPFADWKFNKKNLKASIDNVHYRIYGKNATTSVGFQPQHGYVAFNINGVFAEEKTVLGINPSLSFNFNYDECVNQMLPYFKEQKGTLLEQAKTYLPEVLTESELAEYLSLKNVIVKDSLGKYYEVNILPEADTYATVSIKSGSLYNSLANIVSKSARMQGSPDTSSFELVGGFKTYSLDYTELTNLETTWDMTTHSRLVTQDAPYNIFAIPYGTCRLFDEGTLVATSQKQYAFPLAQSMIQAMSKSNLYDIQLLPYCPIEDIRFYTVDTKTQDAYSLVRDKDDNIVTFILNVPTSSFTRNISYSGVMPTTSIETKISNECDKFRLCSPNFNGYFDFTIAKNGGLEFFNVDCTLKPYQPYIHVNPNFGNLYGRDFDDPRGLICGGDFSLSQYSDAWVEFQVQNKNYQEMFDRQIQNVEFNNKYQRKQEIWNAAVGTVSGGISGAGTAAFMSGGNPYAAAAGAIVGTAVSGVGGIADININDKLRTEALDYTKDNFGYQLGNIQALPYTLTKVSSFNTNNKIFPLLEFYSCTDREKSVLANKIAYNGMTVMAIGTLEDYIGNNWTYHDEYSGQDITSKGYIKGQLIRLEGTNEDFHITTAIANELNKGVYIE